MAEISKEKRSKMMAAVHSRDTKPELTVRKYLWRLGFRYRLNLNRLPGHPDIVLRKYRTCIFVNGCFWHGHDCKDFRIPKTHVEFWENKIRRNQERDKEEHRKLAKMGSAMANAENNFHMDASRLYVSECFVTPGMTMKRMLPGGKGSADRII